MDYLQEPSPIYLPTVRNIKFAVISNSLLQSQALWLCKSHSNHKAEIYDTHTKNNNHRIETNHRRKITYGQRRIKRETMKS
jgi:hypothetical protein